MKKIILVLLLSLIIVSCKKEVITQLPPSDWVIDGISHQGYSVYQNSVVITTDSTSFIKIQFEPNSVIVPGNYKIDISSDSIKIRECYITTNLGPVLPINDSLNVAIIGSKTVITFFDVYWPAGTISASLQLQP